MQIISVIEGDWAVKFAHIGMPWLAFGVEEFVAHSSNVNCLKIGRKTSRVLVTGGEDHKVNLWAIGKPNSILVRLFF
jgi:WD40 repeat protein